MSNKTICILLADGFEEVEAIYPADIFKRLGFNVILAGLDNNIIRGTHDFNIQTPTTLDDISVSDFDALVLPGGLPGATNLRDSAKVLDLVRQADNEHKIIAAICAAPIILHDAGIIKNKRTTGYPTCERLANSGNFHFTGNMVEQDQNIITAIGMGQAAAFAITIAKALGMDNQKISATVKNAFITA